MINKLLSLGTSKVVIYTLLALFSLAVIVKLFNPDVVAGWVDLLLGNVTNDPQFLPVP